MSTLYPAHDDFVAPARDRPQIWRLILGTVITFVIWMLIGLGILVVAMLLSAPEGFFAEIEAWFQSGGEGVFPVEREFSALASGQRPTSVLVMLATFGGLVIGTIASVRWFHRRSVMSLVGPLPKTVRHFGIAVLVAIPLAGVAALLPPYIELNTGLELTVWLTFLPMALLMVAMQTGAEELFFRGYLQQQLAARFRSPIAWMLLPSLLFGLGHMDPNEIQISFANGSPSIEATPFGILILLYTTTFGLFAADLTARSGSIGAAWGFHFANNILAILVVSLEGPLSGLSLWTVSAGAIPPDLLQMAVLRDLALTAVIWLVIRQLLRR